MGALRCRECKSESVRRSGREGFFERLLSLAYVYPFRCAECQHRFLRFRWRERYVSLGIERRETERLRTDFWSTVAWEGGEQQTGRVIDLSASGAQIETDVPIAAGEVIQVSLEATGEEPAIVVDQAVVRRSGPRRMNVQFIRVQKDQEGRLRQYLYEVSVSRLT